MTFDEIIRRSDENDMIAAEVLEEAGMCFGIAIANAVKLLDINLVIIGNLDCNDDNIFLRTIESTVNRESENYAIKHIEIRRGSLDDRNYALGACMFVIDKFYKVPKLKLSIP